MEDVILIIGGAGFLGQHLIKELQDRDETVKEIRVLDLKEYEKKLNYQDKIPVTSIIGDICAPVRGQDTNSEVQNAFKNVNVVYHCAAVVNLEYPPNCDEMERVNVEGTQNVIDLCIENDVKYLIYTSDIVVGMVPLTPSTVIAAMLNETESGAKFPLTESGYIVPGYSPTKLKAEKLVLKNHQSPLNNVNDTLVTTALRVALMYGEGDKIFTNLIKVADRWNGKIPRFAGDGGKHQLIYAGNAAWGHICAKNSLKKDPSKVGGLPVNITDDTPPYDIGRLLNIITTRYSKKLKVGLSSWKLPLLLGYLLALLWVLVVNVMSKFRPMKLDYDPRMIIAYWGSLCYWSRMRASLHMEYEPVYAPDQAMENSGRWYDQWYQKNKRISK